MTIDGKFVDRKTAFIRRVRQIRLRSSVFLLWNARKATLGFGGATKSEFAEFLVHFPTEETFQPMRQAELFIRPSLACRIQSYPSCVSNFSIRFKLHRFDLACRVLAPH